MQKLAEICIRRPVSATMLIVGLVVMGFVSYQRLGVDLFPKVDLPTITVTTAFPGAAPEEVESQITKKIEEAVNTIGGLDELRSVSAEGISQVFVTFVLEKDVDIAAQDVRDKVNAILSDLPEDIEAPIIEKLDPDAAPIMSLAVSGRRSLREMTKIADDQIKKNLESLQGVGQVRFIGDRTRQIQVFVKSDRLAAYNLTVNQVRQALGAQNVEIPGGRLVQGRRETVLRTLGRIEQVDDFNRVIVSNVGGAPVRISDLGYVLDGVEEPRTLARLDDVEAVVLEVRKQSGTNTIAVVDRVKERLAELQRLVPPDFNIQVIRDQSTFIKASFHAVQEHLILGGFLAALVVLLFMKNLRATLIAAVAIPTSIISTFTLMYYMEFTLNQISMLALTLLVGIVIDDAIVVLENIFRFLEEKRMSPMEAAREATREIGLAVTATTFSLVIIFLPVAFLSGIVGRFMSSFGYTAAFAVLISLLVSFTLTPMLSSRFLKVNESGHGASKEGRIYRWLEEAYTAMLEWSLRHRVTVAVVAAAITFSSLPLFITIGKDFLPQDDQSEMEISVRAPLGTSLEGMDRIMRDLQREVEKLPGVAHILTTIGADSQKRVDRGSIFVELVPVDQRAFSQQQLIAQARQSLSRFQNLKIAVQPPSPISGGGNVNKEFQFILQGPELGQLSRYAQEIENEMRAMPAAVDVDSTFEAGKPEVRARVNRDKAADLHVQVGSVAQALSILVGGDDQVTSYREGDDRYDVLLRVEPEERTSIEEVSRLYVPSSTIGNVPLSNVVRLEEGTGPSQIDRYNRQRQISLTANIAAGHSLSELIERVNQKVASLELPPDFQTGLLGRSREFGRAAAAFIGAFVLAFLFMYMVLAAQFESFVDPITILLSLPLSVPFAIFSLFITGSNFSIIYSSLGVLILFGIVKKNSILQVDHAKHLRRQGMERTEALVTASRDRLRPILMTTISLVAGMLPLALGSGAGSGSRRTIAIVVIGGQTLCLLITLLGTPVAYSIFDDIACSPRWRRLGALLNAFPARLRERMTSFFT